MEQKISAVEFLNRERWRKWLETNRIKRKEVWLILPKKSAGGQSYRVYYNEALEEAICFDWIDSRIRSLDATRSLVRFTPRTSKNWSQYNLEKAQKMIREGRMTQSGLKALPRGIGGR